MRLEKTRVDLRTFEVSFALSTQSLFGVACYKLSF